MHSEAMPLIKLEVQHLKHAIIHHMGLVGSELGDHIEKEVDRALKQYPWEARVEQIVHKALNDQIISYFTYGKGATKIKDAIHESFNKLW